MLGEGSRQRSGPTAAVPIPGSSRHACHSRTDRAPPRRRGPQQRRRGLSGEGDLTEEQPAQRTEEITAPTFVVQGTSGSDLPPEQSYAAARTIPDAAAAQTRVVDLLLTGGFGRARAASRTVRPDPCPWRASPARFLGRSGAER